MSNRNKILKKGIPHQELKDIIEERKRLEADTQIKMRKSYRLMVCAFIIQIVTIIILLLK